MYGMVNRALASMARGQFGEERWRSIQERAGVDGDEFLSMVSYPDEVTYRLAAAASAELGVPPEAVLEAFGRYWILYTAQEGYGELLRMSGKTLVEFLLNLDAMHARVGLSFEALRPPSFRCEDVGPTGLTLHYHSTRVGLTHVVVGLLKGLGERFSTPIRVEIVARAEQGADHDVFRVTLLPDVDRPGRSDA